MPLNVQIGLALVSVALVIIGVGVVVVSRIPDDRNEALAAAPGYDLRPPGADRLWTDETTSLAQVGAIRTQLWGIATSEEEYTAYLDATLLAKGWELVRGPDPDMRGGERLLREYRRGDTRFHASRVDQPHRFPGGAKRPQRSYTFLSYTSISNLEE